MINNFNLKPVKHSKLFLCLVLLSLTFSSCKKYLDTEQNGMIRRMMMERDYYGKLIYKNRNEVIVKLISELLRYHEVNFQSPIETEKVIEAKAA